LITECEDGLEPATFFRGVHAVSEPFFGVGIEGVLVSRREVEVSKKNDVEVLGKQVQQSG
jgi:hypothetical protein